MCRENCVLKASSVTIVLQSVQCVLVLIHVLRQVYAEVIHFNLAHGQSVCTSCAHGSMDDAALWMMHHPSPHEGKTSLWPTVR